MLMRLFKSSYCGCSLANIGHIELLCVLTKLKSIMYRKQFKSILKKQGVHLQ